MTMDQKQLELDLQIVQEERKDVQRNKSAQIVDLTRALEVKRQRRMTEIYEAILESVEHIGGTDKLYK